MRSDSKFNFFEEDGVPFEEHLKLVSLRIQSYILNLFDQYSVNRTNRALIEDILSESILRAISYQQKAERGEVASVRSFEALCKWHARNVLVDVLRKDKHIAATIDEKFFQDGATITVMIVEDPCELVITALHNYDKLRFIASETQKLSPRQQEAMLTYIANGADLNDEQPYSFEQAFREVGISLSDYHHELPGDPTQRRCFNSNLHLAMKTIRQASTAGTSL